MKSHRSGQAEIFDREQLEKLWAAMPSFKYQLFFRLCYYTAGRCAEVAQLQVSDIANGKVVYRAANTKTNQTRQVSIPQYLSDEIDSYLRDCGIASGYLFPSESESRGYLSNQAIDKALRKVLKALDWQGYSTHSFRRSMLTHYFNRTGSLTLTREISKHTSLASLEKYLAVTNQAAMAELEAIW